MRKFKISWLLTITCLAVLLTVAPVFGAEAGNLVIHQVTSEVNQDQDSYTVDILVSILDRDHKPFLDLNPQDINLFENGEEVPIDQIEAVKDQPISVIVMLDKSGHLRGSQRTAVRNSVLTLVKSLSQKDSIAVYAFNTEVETLLPLTEDLNRAQDNFRDKNILFGFNACLYDATFQAAQLASQLPTGRRAVVVISGGPNESSSSSACYESTLNETLRLATQDGQFNPFYVIDLDEDPDSNSLSMLADETGGLYFESEFDEELDGLMDQIASRLASQYRITYTAAGIPGTHDIEITFGDYSATSQVVLPVLPPGLRIVSPEETALAPGENTVIIEVNARGIAFERLSLLVGDNLYETSDQINGDQYGFEVDFTPYEGQQVTLSAAAWDKNDELLREISATYDVAVAETEAGATEDVGVVSTTEETGSEADCPEGYVCVGALQLTQTQTWIAGGVLLILVIAIALIIFFVGMKKKKSPVGEAEKESLFEDATLDGFALPVSAMGRLTILSSDDPLMIGKEFQLTKSPTMIGRSVNNDIALPKDTAVSRKHIQILDRNGEIVLSEIMKTLSDGTKQPPTYGTYVNDRKVSGDTILHNGDEISLGRRTKLRYEGPDQPEDEASSEDVTMDQIQLPDIESFDDATMDG
jgi:VWFA-related protein